LRPLVKLMGPLVYPVAAARCLAARAAPIRGRVTGDRIDETVDLSIAMVSNQACFGGRFSTSPQADNGDGKLDLCLVEKVSGPLGMLRVAGQIYQGLPQGCPGTRQFQVRRLSLKTDSPVSFFADGDLMETTDRFEMEVEPGVLNVAIAAG
jgi:diacylglycerol kinase family enzyme